MFHWQQLQFVLGKQNIPAVDQELVRDFLNNFSFPIRQQLLGTFLNFPEKIKLFLDLLKKKIDLAAHPDPETLKNILELEKKEIESFGVDQ